MSRYEDDRIYYERDRDGGRERDRYYEDDRAYMRGGRSRDDDRYDRRPPPRAYDDDFVRDRRYHDDDFRYERRGPPSGAGGSDYDRRVIIDRERDREYIREPSPRRPPVLTRRQSSLDTHDRRPLRGFEDRYEYPPPARREDIRRDDFRAPPYEPIPLPRSEAAPPSRRYERDYYDDERVNERDYYIEDGRRYPEHVHEREIIRERDRRDSSRESRARTHTHRSRSRSRSSSKSSSSRGGASTVRSEYPKKGKTRIPARLVSKRAIIDLQYPFTEEGTTIIIQRALGQDHIDELLKLSEDYMKTEVIISDNKTSGGEVVEERKEERREEVVIQPSAPPTVVVPPPAPAPPPVIVDATPSHDHHATMEVTDRTVIRESSPHHHHHHHPDELIVAPIRSRSRSRSRSGRDIRHEIKALERELHERDRVAVEDYDVVRTERLEDGQVVVYEERIERTTPAHKPPRIEKDKKGPPPGILRAMLTSLT